ncbi:hypothetical protein SAMN02745171_00908 [Porphyromonas circumdentaria]|uniref:Uncharacterized protein n=1 Tax=Porphyromonas circumdentaria TaxID=29524 RepID=A0A1T4MVK4_9PORP|nr:hypothetical protein [Porphyromonas circumdentaria]SJZ70876.1 hypothetical protein SAMN02745171_00908 [Porphyromonas circumdentaria]
MIIRTKKELLGSYVKSSFGVCSSRRAFCLGGISWVYVLGKELLLLMKLMV